MEGTSTRLFLLFFYVLLAVVLAIIIWRLARKNRQPFKERNDTAAAGMVSLPAVYIIQASDASRHTGKLQEILRKLKTENRINGFVTFSTGDSLSSLADKIEDEDLIFLLLTDQLEPQKEQIENTLKALKTKQPGLKITEIIVDNVVFHIEFITFPTDLRPIRDREDKDTAWNNIEQNLKAMVPVPPSPSPPQPNGRSKRLETGLKITGIVIAAYVVFTVMYLLTMKFSVDIGPRILLSLRYFIPFFIGLLVAFFLFKRIFRN